MASWAQLTRRLLRPAAVAALMVAPSFALAANTVQDFSANFPPPPGPTPLTLTGIAHLQPGSLTGDPSVSFLRLTDDNVGANGQAGLGQVLSNVGAYDRLVFDFDFRANDPAAGADGFSFAYLPVSTYGASGPAPALNEEPNAAGVLGIGFDTWNNDDGTDGTDVGLGGVDGSLPDSLSLHWNGTRLASVSMLNPILSLPADWLENDMTKHATITIVPGVGGSDVHLLVTEPSSTLTAQPFGTGAGTFVTGLLPYDGRIGLSGRTGGENQNQEIDNMVSTFTPAGGSPIVTLVNDFDSLGPPPPPAPTLLGGTPFAAQQHGQPPAGGVVPTFPLPPSGGDADGHYQLTADNIPSQLNSIAFDKTFGTLRDGDVIVGSFDIRVVNTNANTADGMSFMLADTAIYGDTGPLAPGVNITEDPNNGGMVALGFDTFDNDEDFAAGDPNGCGGGGPCVDRRANSISAHANGAQLDQQFLPNIQYNDGNWIQVQFALTAIDDGAGGLAGLLDVVATDLTTGETFQAFGGLGIPNLPADLRVAFGARTGGEFDGQFIDNVNIEHQAAIPEPSSIALAVTAFGLVAFGQRRRWLSNRAS
jgi:hypothetical protein